MEDGRWEMGDGCWKMEDGGWKIEDGCRMVDVFLTPGAPGFFLIILMLMGTKALRSAKGRNIFGVDELMMDAG